MTSALSKVNGLPIKLVERQIRRESSTGLIPETMLRGWQSQYLKYPPKMPAGFAEPTKRLVKAKRRK